MSGKLRRAIVTVSLTALCGFGVPVAQPADDAATAFNLADADKNGSIDVEEYRARMIVVFAALDKNDDGFVVLAEVPDDRKDVFAEVDADGNKRIILREYLLDVMPRFWKADEDGDNLLSPAEVKASSKREAAS